MNLRRLIPIIVLLALPFLVGADSIIQARRPVLQQPPDGWTTDTLTPTLRWQAEGNVQVRLTAAGSQTPIVDEFLPAGVEALTTPPLASGQQYHWKVRTNPFDVSSVYTWSVWSPEYAFTTIGNLPWNLSAYARPTAPKNGAIASSVTPTLTWDAPVGSTHYEMVLTPANNERASVRFVNTIGTSYKIPGAPVWYGMLPDAVYYWRVRVNNAPGPVPDDHPSWGPWSEVYAFRTPVPSSQLLGPLTPAHQTTVRDTTPVLQWSNPNDDVFFYEVQLSKDPDFITDPARSVAPVYWETVHGGMTTPRNSYQVTGRYALEQGQNYFWRVRAAVPGGQREAPWGPTWSFHVD